MQSTERFGVGTDPDGDGVVNELTRADITAAALYQATLPVPVRNVPENLGIRRAAADGERLFTQIGCSTCHIPALPLDQKGWIFTEPGPDNPTGNLQAGQAQTLSIDLSSEDLPHPASETRAWNRDGSALHRFQAPRYLAGPNDPMWRRSTPMPKRAHRNSSRATLAS